MILDMPIGQYGFSLSWEWFSREFAMIWQPLLLGSFICATVAAIVGVIFVRIAWRLVVIRSWLQRKNKQLPKD
jgi:hypothetical protein